MGTELRSELKSRNLAMHGQIKLLTTAILCIEHKYRLLPLCSINFSIHWARSELRGCPRRPVPRLATFWGAGKSRRARAPSAATARIWARKQVICDALEFARTYFGSAETTPEAAQLNTRHRESSSLRWLFILFVKILARGSSYFSIQSLIFSTAIEVPHEIRL